MRVNTEIYTGMAAMRLRHAIWHIGCAEGDDGPEHAIEHLAAAFRELHQSADDFAEAGNETGELRALQLLDQVDARLCEETCNEC
jgi:hypothetical protein